MAFAAVYMSKSWLLMTAEMTPWLLAYRSFSAAWILSPTLNAEPKNTYPWMWTARILCRRTCMAYCSLPYRRCVERDGRRLITLLPDAIE